MQNRCTEQESAQEHKAGMQGSSGLFTVLIFEIAVIYARGNRSEDDGCNEPCALVILYQQEKSGVQGAVEHPVVCVNAQ